MKTGRSSLRRLPLPISIWRNRGRLYLYAFLAPVGVLVG
jgi:hypothetical protein